MDLNNLETWQYFALGGGGLLVVAVILYFLPVGKLKVPAVLTAGFGGAVGGLAAGILLMASFGYKLNRPEDPPESDDAAIARAQMKGGGGGGGMMAGMPKGGGGMPKGGGGGGFGGPPSPKVQLASLVTALDRVADRPVTLTLTAAERQAIAEQLKGLDAPAELSEGDAQAKLDAIHKVVEKDRDTLEAVGYRGLGQGKGGGAGFGKGGPKDTPPNPFKDGPAAERLKSLLDRLNPKK